MSDPLKPSMSLLVKIGSALVHVDECLSEDGENAIFDLAPVTATMKDPEIIAWVKEMGPLLPLRRKK